MPFLRMLDMLRSCVKRTIGHETDAEVSFIFCGDSSRQKLDRSKIDPTYKEERPSLTNLNFYIFRNVMTPVLKDLGLEIISHDGAEGDDVIASLVHKFSKKCDCTKQCTNCKCASTQLYNHIIVFSCDRDLNSLLEYNNVTIYRPPSIFYNRQGFEEEYGFHPKLFPVYKALVGDKSDGIKGVDLWGDARAKKHIAQLDWMAILDKDHTIDQFEKALTLVTLRTDIPGLPDRGFDVVGNNGVEGLGKIQLEYHRKEAVEDVKFAEMRLVEACNADHKFDWGGDLNEKDEQTDKDLPF